MCGFVLLMIVGWFVIAFALGLLAVIASFVTVPGVTSALAVQLLTGWVVLGLVSLVVTGIVLKFVVKKIFKGFAEALENIGGMGKHFVIELGAAKPEQVAAFESNEKARHYRQQLMEMGFVSEGSYAIQEIPGLSIWALRHPERHIYAVVYLHPAGVKEPWVDLSADYQDGKELNVSNVPIKPVMRARPEKIRVYESDADVVKLMSLFDRNQPDSPILETEPDNFAIMFEKSYWKDMYFQKQIGFVSETEVREIGEMPNLKTGEKPQEKPTDEEVKLTQETEVALYKAAWDDLADKLTRKSVGLLAVEEIAVLCAARGPVDPDDDEDVKAVEDMTLEEKQERAVGRLVAAHEGQSVQEFRAHLKSRLESLPGAVDDEESSAGGAAAGKSPRFNAENDGFRLLAATEEAADGLAAARAVEKKFPEWFIPVYVGKHPLQFEVYRLAV